MAVRSYSLAPGAQRRARVLAGLFSCAVAVVAAARPPDIRRPIEALPPHVAGAFRDAARFEQRSSGDYLVFDRGGHTVFRVDPSRERTEELVHIGGEEGRLLQPMAFDVAQDGSFAVADAPFGRQRVQVFSTSGSRLSGFALPGPVEARLTLGGLVLNGVGSLSYDGERLYVNQPETGALVTTYSILGRAERSFGRLRSTPYESSDRELHLALNTGLPLVDPRGGFYFVFQAGEPRFRKYDAAGTLVFERVIQGREIDQLLANQPTSWPTRSTTGRELPVVPPIVRAAAVDPAGRLWVSFVVPWTYVYDADGEKARVLQFSTTGIVAPTSLSFGAGGRLLITPGCYIFDAAID